MSVRRVSIVSGTLAVVLGGGFYLAANAADPAPKHASVYRVVSGPVEFLGCLFKSADGDATVRDVATPLVDGDTVRVGDTIETGIIRCTGPVFALKDSEGTWMRFGDGEGAIVIVDDNPLKTEKCADCATLAKATCGDGCVKSVSCKADGSCAFVCKDECQAN